MHTINTPTFRIMLLNYVYSTIDTPSHTHKNNTPTLSHTYIHTQKIPKGRQWMHQNLLTSEALPNYRTWLAVVCLAQAWYICKWSTISIFEFAKSHAHIVSYFAESPQKNVHVRAPRVCLRRRMGGWVNKLREQWWGRRPFVLADFSLTNHSCWSSWIWPIFQVISFSRNAWHLHSIRNKASCILIIVLAF